MGVKITKDGLPDLVRSVVALTKMSVLVGIPDANADREPVDGEASAINSATIGYIMETGSPAHNIPPRPFLVPGIQEAKEPIIAAMKRAGLAALDANAAKVDKALNAVGLAAQKSVKNKISTGPFEPLKEGTIEARLRRLQKYKTAGRQRRARMMAAYLEGTFSPLIDSGQMRDAITYVIRKARGK